MSECSSIGFRQEAGPAVFSESMVCCVSGNGIFATRHPVSLAIGSSASVPHPSLLLCPSVPQGVGPATASAVLQAFHSSIPFMSDEAMTAALGEKAYTVPVALEFTKALRQKAVELERLDREGEAGTLQDMHDGPQMK